MSITFHGTPNSAQLFDYWWECHDHGMADFQGRDVAFFRVVPCDREYFPELAGVYGVRLTVCGYETFPDMMSFSHAVSQEMMR